MFLRALVSAVLMLATPAMAAGASKPNKAASTLLMSPVALPVVSEGRLVNYIYVNLRLSLSPGVDSEKLREKEPFFRDALVRAAHRTRLAPARDNNRLDETKLRAVLLHEAVRVAGKGAVTGVQVLRAQPQRQVSNP